MVRSSWSHQAYAQAFDLNIEQLGEILVSAAVRGKKMGDAQPCFDIQTSALAMSKALLAGGISDKAVRPLLGSENKIRIEVKSKLAWTASGRANVIHCRNKFVSKRGHPPASHLALLLFDGAGTFAVERAFLMTKDVALGLRRMETKSQYIPVAAVLKLAAESMPGLVELTSLLNEIGRQRI